MARSLVVSHDEAPRTSALFTAFLLLCGGLLAVGTAVGASSDAAEIDPGPSMQPIGEVSSAGLRP